MKKLVLILLSPVIALLFSFSEHGEGDLHIGDFMPLGATVVKDISGEDIQMRSLMETNGLLVIFSCNTCPFVLAWEDSYPALGELTSSSDIGMVLVNSNEAKRDGDDSFDEMVTHAKEAGYNTPYVVDTDHKLADAFGARTTPHVYLFDKNMQLVYKGAIDNKYEVSDKVATKFYLEDAIGQMLEGGEIDPAETVNKGCSIKRVKK
jgi:hypothetical protein